MTFLDVIIPQALNKTLTYEYLGTEKLEIGQRIRIPLGKKSVTGLIDSLHETSPYQKTAKPIIEVLDPFPLINAPYLDWLKWASQYYLHPLGEILKMAIPNTFWEDIHWDKISLKKSRLQSAPIENDSGQKQLNKNQNEIYEKLSAALLQNTFSTHLLLGVTGSGKTELYLQLTKQCLNLGKQVLVLVPEIGLTPQISNRFVSCFDSVIGQYHSGLTENQKLLEWVKILQNQTQVLIGTRSSLFAPFKNLGLIIIDEEHDPSYKQEDRFRYHARDLAIVRAQKEGIPILLGSATPSLESYNNALDQKYELHELPDRATSQKLPRIHIIDWAAEKRQTQSPLNISQILHQAIKENLTNKEQVILFINRRGFATSLFCLDCHKGLMCQNCSVTLTYHKTDHKLHCHHCQYKMNTPKNCPDCGGLQTLLTGIGSQTIEDEIKTYFPSARIVRMDRDNLKSKKSLQEMLTQFKNHEIDILIGTQMIAKGHDFPNVTMVGILGADFSSGMPDFRSNERAFQLICQVAGRSGRGDKPGKVYIQSLWPEHPLLKIAQDQNYKQFAESEAIERKELGYPPFGKLILFEISALDKEKLGIFLKNLGSFQALKNPPPHIHVLGPSMAPLEKIQNWYRAFILLKSNQRTGLKSFAHLLMTHLKKEAPSHIKWTVDVDPMNML
ncbi:MAG: hypothetical protein ACD_73C00724G0007 [uncultured bacterium]|nr:MAG: hypothetical protein ACD_73C00724G0007 [uncultured bacterium]